MNIGYQLVEPPSVAALLAKSHSASITVALLTWLIEVASEELKDDLVDKQLAVIRAEYVGAYPAIGIHYGSPGATDFAPRLEATFARLLAERHVGDFVSFLSRSTTNWDAEAAALTGAADSSSSHG